MVRSAQRSRRWLIAAPPVIGVLLALPSLGSGLFLDDYLLQATISGAPALQEVFPPRLNLWAFVTGDAERTRRMMDLGILPWWTCECARLFFWRPLASLTHWLDFTRWAGLPTVMHAHSVAWFGILIAAVALTYRQLTGGVRTAAFAALLYAVNGNYATVVAWISSRNLLIAATFGFLCLWAHDRWRRAGRLSGLLLSPVLLACGLMASEAAVATAAYVAAHIAFMDRAPWRRRLFIAAAPCGLVLVTWLIVYQSGGYGVAAVAPVYVNPLHEPIAFAKRIVTHGPILLLAQWIPVFSSDDYAALTGSAAFLRWLVALVVVSTLGLALAPLLRSDRVSRVLGLGHLLALLPIVAASPTDRYTMFVGFGAMGLIARFIGWALDRDRPPAPSRMSRVAPLAIACVLASLHVIVSPVRFVHGAAIFPGDRGHLERCTRQIGPPAEGRRMVIVNAPDPGCVIPAVFIRGARGERIAGQTLALTYSSAAVRLSRMDTTTVVVTPLGRQDLLFWPGGLKVGHEVKLTGVTIRVTALGEDGGPGEFSVTFDVPLEHPSLRWIRWTGKEGYVPFTPPGIGQTVEVAA